VADDSPPAPPAVADQPARPRELSLLGGRLKVDPARQMILGSPRAKFVVVELFDYTCPDCREMHGYLDFARREFGSQLAIVVLPVPLNTDCNAHVDQTRPLHENACTLARLAIATWQHKPRRFEELHDWLFDSDKPRTVEEARGYVANILGEQELAAALADAAVAEHLRRCTDVYATCNKGRIPKLLMGKGIYTQFSSRADLLGTLENALGISRYDK